MEFDASFFFSFVNPNMCVMCLDRLCAWGYESIAYDGGVCAVIEG